MNNGASEQKDEREISLVGSPLERKLQDASLLVQSIAPDLAEELLEQIQILKMRKLRANKIEVDDERMITSKSTPQSYEQKWEKFLKFLANQMNLVLDINNNMERFLEYLEPREREVLRLRYRDMLSKRELAKKLEISATTVANIEKRALNKIQMVLGRDNHKPIV